MDTLDYWGANCIIGHSAILRDLPITFNEVRETEIEIQRGIFVIKRTLVPMIRVQHVETNQGPFLRKYDLASVEVSTAATVHTIPALDFQ